MAQEGFAHGGSTPKVKAPAVTAQVVGNAFVKRYYDILHHSPWLVHGFYKDSSIIGRPDSSMSVTTTKGTINAKLQLLNYGTFEALIESVDAQESLNGAVNVLVTGYLAGKDNFRQCFTQLFFLAPQAKGYFVLNDMLRHIENAPREGDPAPISATFDQAPKTVQMPENNICHPSTMAASEAAAGAIPISAQVIGNVFVQRYYHILHQSPWLVHRFYKDISIIGRHEEDGSFSVTTTKDAINAKLLPFNYVDFKAQIRSVDVQESLNGGVNVLVTGYFARKDNILQNFIQSFFIAPLDKDNYFVLNDIFRYVENANHHEGDHASSPVKPECVGNKQVGDSFAKHYYHILHESPWLVHQFYMERSTLGRPQDDGFLSVTTTIEAINAKIKSLNYGDCSTCIRSVDVQESLKGGVIVLVTGYLTGKDNILRSFAQSFFLAPQVKGTYFVLNDMFRYMEDANHHEGDNASNPATSVQSLETIPEPVYIKFPSTMAILPSESSTTGRTGLSPEVIGKVFVGYYYPTLYHLPWLLHESYKDVSTLGRSEEDGSFSATTTIDAIKAKILSLNYGEYKFDIRSVDVQVSLDGGIDVLVTGYVAGEDNIMRSFTQVLFLAPKDKGGYFVLHDMFRYM